MTTQTKAQSQSDEERARDLANKIENELMGSINSGCGIDIILQAFAAIRQEASDRTLPDEVIAVRFIVEKDGKQEVAYWDKDNHSGEGETPRAAVLAAIEKIGSTRK